MRALNLLVALGAFAILLALVLGKRRLTRAPAWLLLRSLFPSWRFFEQIAPAPVLRYRVAEASTDFGPWQDALSRVARTPGSLFLNSRGNVQLACQSLVERLVDELDSVAPNSLPEAVSYQLVQRLVRSRLSATTEAEPRCYQFQIALLDSDEEHACFVSAVHEGRSGQ